MKAIANTPTPWLRAVVFDLDEALLDRSRAWRYALEQAVLVVTGQRVDARAIEAEYRTRPWRHALSVVVADTKDLGRCEEVCRDMYARSAMKHLLVHDGLGMALDSLRGARIDMCAVSREPHRIALTQMESTGLDRFLGVLAATPAGEAWDAGERIAHCLTFLDRPAAVAAFVSGDLGDIGAAVRLGLHAAVAGWTGAESMRQPTLSHPRELAGLARLLGGPERR
ncbi:MAG: HAD family hydrolase [Dehalococcoidia bacterium]